MYIKNNDSIDLYLYPTHCLTVEFWSTKKSICIARIWAGHKEISSYTLCKQGRTSMLTTVHSVNGYLLRFVYVSDTQ